MSLQVSLVLRSSNPDWNELENCGGYDIWVALCSSIRGCCRLPGHNIGGGQSRTWEYRDIRRSSCNGFLITPDTTVQIQTSSRNDFCPKLVTVYTRNLAEYRTDQFSNLVLDKWRSDGHFALKPKEQPISCPRPHQSCPANQIGVFRNSTNPVRKMCMVVCPTVIGFGGEGQGIICRDVNHKVHDVSFCCKQNRYDNHNPSLGSIAYLEFF